MKRGGIAEKWFYVTLLPTLATVLLACFATFFISRQNYYLSAEQAIAFRIRLVEDALPQDALSQQERYRSLVSQVEEFAEKERFEFMVLNDEGDVLVTSSGFPYSSHTVQKDFGLALMSDNGRGSFTGHTENGTHIIAVTQLLPEGYADARAIRFVCSLQGIDSQLRMLLNISLLVAASMVALITLTGSVFIRSLVQPLGKIDSTAKKIAGGSLDDRIENSYSGEIGTLCDTINEMATALESSNRMKNDFISSISHELRTPLTSIKGWAETLGAIGEEDPELMQKGMEIITDEADRLSLLVEDLLDFSRLEAKRDLNLYLANLDLAAELGDAVLTVAQRARKLGVEVRYREPQQAVIVSADKNRLKQVFTNIFDNALKYSSRKKSITVKLETHNGYAEVSIRDRGPGIPKEELDKVTQRYYRASNSVYGTGIGLSLVNEIMSAHGGKLLIESALGRGTTVRLLLPLLGQSSEA